MNAALTSEELAALGFGADAAVECAEIPLDPLVVERGAGLASALALSVAVLVQSPGVRSQMERIGDAAVEACGFDQRIHPDAPHLREISRLDGEAVMVTGGVCEYPDSTNRACVIVDLKASPFVGVSAESGETIAFKLLDEHTAARFVLAPTITHVAPLERVDSPVLAWVAAHPDPWLRAAVAARVAPGDAFSMAAATGLFAAHAPTLNAREAMDAHLAGHGEPARALAGQWVRGLTAAQVETLTDLAVAEADDLRRLVETLAEEPRPEASSWRAGLSVLALGRDDLEGIWAMLAERGPMARLRDALFALDRRATLMIEAFPEHIGLDDERLRRVAALDPEAWWGALA